MKHPGEAELALYGGGDLGVWRKWRIGRHLAACPGCRERAELYRADAGALAGLEMEIPPELGWSGLAGEMRANIRVGLAAGECVAAAGRRGERLNWRAALALASILAVILTGWWLYLPGPAGGPARQEAVIATTVNEIELKQNGSTLALAHPSDQRTVLTANTDGAVRARYVDGDSGQVTINNVYVQ